MIVNGFDRLSGPAVIDTPTEAGFDLTKDPGVPYLYDISLCGAQTEFSRKQTGKELGRSGSRMGKGNCELPEIASIIRSYTERRYRHPEIIVSCHAVMKP